MTVTVSQQGSALAALVEAAVFDRRSGQSQQEQAFVLSRAADGGNPLDVVIRPRNLGVLPIKSVVADTQSGALQIIGYGRMCQSSLTKVSDKFPTGFADRAAGLIGAWSTPSPENARDQSRLLRGTSALLEFRRDGDRIDGQIRAFYPAEKPLAEQNRLVASLRPITIMDDGRIAVLMTQRERTDGAFAAGRGLQPLMLLIKPPALQDRQLALSVIDRGWSAAPDIMFNRRNEADAAAIILGGAPVELPAGLGGRLAAARSMREQCDVLADWSRPFTNRPNVTTTPVNQLEPEARPLFDDVAFVPVFGLPYSSTTPPQRQVIFRMLNQTCANTFKMNELSHWNIYNPWTENGYIAAMALLAAARDADGRVAEAAERARELPDSQAGLDELARIERGASDSLIKLDERQRLSFATVIAETRKRITLAILRSRIAASSTLPPNMASLEVLERLEHDISLSALLTEEKSAAIADVRRRTESMLQAMLDDLVRQAAAAPATLTGLVDVTGVLRQADQLRVRANSRAAAATVAVEAIKTRRAALRADPTILQQFHAELFAVGQARGAEGVRAAAAPLLLPSETASNDAYVAALNTELQRVENDRRNRLLGEQSTASSTLAESTATPAQAPSSTGEPSARDMLDALEGIVAGVNAGQTNLAERCARRDFQNDPLLAFQCISQIGAGGPMHLETTGFRKIACAPAVGQPGYLCDYTMANRLSGGRPLGALGEAIAAPSDCTGRFVRTASNWIVREHNCQ